MKRVLLIFLNLLLILSDYEASSFVNNTNKISNDLQNRRDLLIKLSKIGHESQSREADHSLYSDEVQSEKSPKTKKSHLRGITHIMSIYSSVNNGKPILNDKKINSVRYIPSSKGKQPFTNTFIPICLTN